MAPLHPAPHAATVLALLAASGAAHASATPVAGARGAEARGAEARIVRGVTVSCQTWGREWGSDGFGAELDDLARLGVNWVAIHPYASVRADGSLRWRELDPERPPEWIARPIREAHARGLSILVVPHVAHWGGPWSWRGEVDFADPAALERFFADYERWIAAVAACAREADGFCVASELDRLARHDARWRRVIAAVRARTPARLTWAATWNAYEEVPFWDALDAVGVQAYFPVGGAGEPDEDALRAAWTPILARLYALHQRTGKPVVFTELGYNCSLDAAREPWAYPQASGADVPRAAALQERCLRVALESIGRESQWLRGAFLWKWFVGPAPGENFVLQTPPLRAVIRAAWGPESPPEAR